MEIRVLNSSTELLKELCQCGYSKKVCSLSEPLNINKRSTLLLFMFVGTRIVYIQFRCKGEFVLVWAKNNKARFFKV